MKKIVILYAGLVLLLGDNDFKEGVFKTYYPNGTMQTYKEYRSNHLDGEVRRYHPHNIIYEKSHYKKGFLEGECIQYFDNGKIHKQQYYKKDDRVGKGSAYTKDGILKLTANYQDDKLNGTCIQYTNGKKRFEVEFKDDKALRGSLYFEEGEGVKMDAIYLKAMKEECDLF